MGCPFKQAVIHMVSATIADFLRELVLSNIEAIISLNASMKKEVFLYEYSITVR